MNNNQLLTEDASSDKQLCGKNGSRADDITESEPRSPKSSSRAVSDLEERKSENLDRARHRMTHDPLPSDRQSDHRHADLRNESTDTSDPQPLTRPKHPPSYNSSLSRNGIYQQPHTTFQSSAKKRTCQQAVLRPQDQSLTTHKSTIKFTGKRANSDMTPATDSPPGHRSDGSLVVRSEESDGCENQMPTNGSSCCWQSDLQEMRIREEYERKKLEKDQLLVKASGLEAEIAVCRQKIQLLSDRIRGKTLLSLQFLF